MELLSTMTKDKFSVRLIDRLEVVEYTDENHIYRFDVGKEANEWVIYLPPSREMAPTDADQILRRITEYLSKRRWFWIFPRTYSVRIEHK
jgi:hypothetical protein